MFTPPEVATDWPAAWLPGQAKAAPRRKGKLLAPGGGKTSAECYGETNANIQFLFKTTIYLHVVFTSTQVCLYVTG